MNYHLNRLVHLLPDYNRIKQTDKAVGAEGISRWDSGKERLTWPRVGFIPSITAIRIADGLYVFVGVCLQFTLISLGRELQKENHVQLS